MVIDNDSAYLPKNFSRSSSVAELTTSKKLVVVFLIQKRGLTERRKEGVIEKTLGKMNSKKNLQVFFSMVPTFFGISIICNNSVFMTLIGEERFFQPPKRP
jgi:hypothetical protein